MAKAMLADDLAERGDKRDFNTVWQEEEEVWRAKAIKIIEAILGR